jgi:hypothetical protein
VPAICAFVQVPNRAHVVSNSSTEPLVPPHKQQQMLPTPAAKLRSAAQPLSQCSLTACSPVHLLRFAHPPPLSTLPHPHHQAPSIPPSPPTLTHTTTAASPTHLTPLPNSTPYPLTTNPPPPPTRHAGRGARQLQQQVVGRSWRPVLSHHMQDVGTPASVRQRDMHLTVKPPGAAQRWVNAVGPVDQ